MATNDRAFISPGQQQLTPVPRRRFVEVLLGTGFVATAAAFIYPVCATLSYREPQTSEAMLLLRERSES